MLARKLLLSAGCRQYGGSAELHDGLARKDQMNDAARSGGAPRDYPIVFGITLLLGLVWMALVGLGAWATGIPKLRLIAVAVTVGFLFGASLAWRVGNYLRQVAMPTMFFSRGFFDTINKRVFWAIGPQVIGVALLAVAGTVVVYGMAPVQTSQNSNTHQSALPSTAPAATSKPPALARAAAMGVPAAAASAPIPLSPPHAISESGVPELLDRIYGRYDKVHQCWLTSSESADQNYCMKVVKTDAIMSDTGRRTYVLTAGHAVQDDGEPESAHVLSGLVGAFVIESHGGQNELIAANRSIEVGASGAAPVKWGLLKLAPTDYWGWQASWGDCHQGYCGERLVILAPFGKSIKDVAAISIRYNNDSACAGSGCSEGQSSVTSKITVDTAAINAKIFPLRVSLNGTLNGRPLSPKPWSLEFDPKKWAYVPPPGWPLSEVEF
jgi:hypothetical protein